MRTISRSRGMRTRATMAWAISPVNCRSQASAQAANWHVPVEDAKGDHAAHTHGAAAKDRVDDRYRRRQRSRITTLRRARRGPRACERSSRSRGMRTRGNNGLGHQSRELPSQASAQAAKDVPVEDAKGDHAAHAHGAAAKDLVDDRYPGASDRGERRSGRPRRASGHVNDQAAVGECGPGQQWPSVP